MCSASLDEASDVLERFHVNEHGHEIGTARHDREVLEFVARDASLQDLRGTSEPAPRDVARAEFGKVIHSPVTGRLPTRMRCDRSERGLVRSDMNNILRCAALTTTMLAACLPIGAPATTPMPPAPMTNADALAYAKAHPYTGGKMVTAVNNLGVPVCRLVILAETGHDDRALIGEQYVNQAGANDPKRGSLDPADQPFLTANGESPAFYPNVPDPQPAQMVVTAFGCLRTRDGQFFPDERTVLMQKHMRVAVNSRLALKR